MILDDFNIMSDDQEETTVDTHVSDQTIDLSAAKRGGRGNPVRIRVRVRDAVTSDGAATVQFKIETCAESTFSSATELYDSGAIGKATLVAGYMVFDGYVPGTVLRYLRVTYTIADAALTAGSFDAAIMLQADDHDQI